MEFDKSRVYTAVNADELKIGSKCIFADDLNMLRKKVQEAENYVLELTGIAEDCEMFRFKNFDDEYALVYLVELPKELEYKPFSSTAKAMKAIIKHEGWIKDKITENPFFVDPYCMNILSTKTAWLNMQELFSKYVFLDDDSPCGELAEE